MILTRRRGFAIIAIRAAIPFPVFAQVRDKARMATCGSNARQLSLVVQAYAQDFDEVLPRACNYDAPTTAPNRR